MLKALIRTTGLTAAMFLALAGVARADVTLGSTTQPAGSTSDACHGSVIAPLTTDPATPFTIPNPSPGAILQWRVNTAGSAPGTPISLVILRQAGSIYTVTAVDSQAIPNPLPAGGIASFTPSAPIPVAAGDILALYGPETGFECFWRDGATPDLDKLIALAAFPPAVGQPRQVTNSSGPGFVLNLAATAGPIPVTKKKCKKKHKKHSAESAKKKKCKKKKKR